MKYCLKDSYGRSIEFEGELLAEASSEKPHKLRWTEIRVYKVENKNFILETVGCSVAYTNVKRTKSHYMHKIVDVNEIPEGYEKDFSYKPDGTNKVALELDKYTVLQYADLRSLAYHGLKINKYQSGLAFEIIKQLSAKYDIEDVISMDVKL